MISRLCEHQRYNSMTEVRQLASAPAFASTAARKFSLRGDITMGLMVLVLGLILFLGPHVFVTMRPQRDAAVKQLGVWPYKGLFAVVSVAGLYVTGKGFGMYDAAGPLVLWRSEERRVGKEGR